MKLRIGTRGSRLALVQARHIAAALRAEGHETELVIISTKGDQVTDRPFSAIGPPGVFVREIETALLEERIDLAVHSYKDLPTASPDGLVVAAVPERVDPADVLVVDGGGDSLDALADGALVGTSSSRRAALLADARPDLRIEGVRGNVPTRLRKCRDEAYDAIVLAAAGLDRLRRDGLEMIEGQTLVRLPVEAFVPAPSQGALALQVKAGTAAEPAVAALDDAAVRAAVAAERAVLAALEGGCDAAIGAFCRSTDDGFELLAAFGADDGLRRARAAGPDPAALVAPVVAELR